MFYNDTVDGGNDNGGNDDHDEQQQQQKGPMPGKWWRGMIWWFSAKEAAYKVRRGSCLRSSVQDRDVPCCVGSAGQISFIWLRW
jgi:hypothetical protein